VPLVFLDVGRDAREIINIAINYQQAGVRHLAALRHSRIAFIPDGQS
jgi:DNA-binding LacI/PurR family transcriptional regulator